MQASVRIMLGPQSGDADVVDEIAARVWYALVANDGELLRNTIPVGAKLITFVRRWRRMKSYGSSARKCVAASANRRVASGRAVKGKTFQQPLNLLPEFLGTLTPRRVPSAAVI